MKAMAITAVLGALVAIPFLLGRRKPGLVPLPVAGSRFPRETESNLRYDVDDFLTE